MEVHIESTQDEIVKKFVKDFAAAVDKEGEIHIAISGGKTPLAGFTLLATEYNGVIDWENIHIYWVDERCVPPNDPDSNYNMAVLSFLSMIDIDNSNIHRIKGEEDPDKEALRYSIEILKYVPQVNGLPSFDFVWLGMGDDGHVASLFPHELKYLKTNRICEVASHPKTGQKRVTMTGNVLNNAKNVSFLVTGMEKAEKVQSVLRNGIDHDLLPASHIVPAKGTLNWYIDREAASSLHG